MKHRSVILLGNLRRHGCVVGIQNSRSSGRVVGDDSIFDETLKGLSLVLVENQRMQSTDGILTMVFWLVVYVALPI